MQTNLFGRPAVLAAVLALMPAGCSFAFVDGPPTMHKQLPYFDCTSSNVLPTVDAVLGGIYGIAAVGTLVNSSGQSSTYSNDNSDAILAGAAAALLVSSAIYGYQKTSSCREAKEQLMLRLPSGPGFAPPAARPPVDPWLSPPPSTFSAPPPEPAAPPAPTPPGPTQDNEVPKP